MIVWHSSSSEGKSCVVCRRKTGTYKIYEQTNIQIKIPLCDTHERHCYKEVDIEDIANIAIKLINREIKQKNNSCANTSKE